MHTARSAMRTCIASRSTVEYTATASAPSACSARITRTATSPRFATRTRLNKRPARERLELEQQLAELDGLAVLDVDRPDDPLGLRLDLVHQLHRLEDAERLPRRDRVALLDEHRCARLRRPVEGADHRRLDAHETVRERRCDHRLELRFAVGGDRDRSDPWLRCAAYRHAHA